MNLSKFISQLKELKDAKNPMFSAIKYSLMFFKALEELDTMVGMASIKKDVINLIQVLIVRKLRSESIISEDRLLHTMLLGNPGTGKTTVGMIFCKIYTSLDILTMPQNSSIEQKKSLSISQDVKIMRTQIVDDGKDKLINQLVNQKTWLLQQLHERDTKMTGIYNSLRYHQNRTLATLKNLGRYKQDLIYAHYNPTGIESGMQEIRGLNNNLTGVMTLHFGNNFCPWVQRVDSYLPTQNAQQLVSNSSSEPPTEMKKADESEPTPIYVVGTRADLVGTYLGETAQKTRKFLDSAMGGVAFIDEAYDLFQLGYSKGDAFGGEALTVIVDYMTRFSSNLVIIFAGYEKAMKCTILEGQEGLKSRIGYAYNIEPYSTDELSQIFVRQLHKAKWEMDDVKLAPLIKEYKDTCVVNGRDTQNLVSKCINVHARISFEHALKNEAIPTKLTKRMIVEGLKELECMDKSLTTELSKPPPGMFN